jgi:hypothetical protein
MLRNFIVERRRGVSAAARQTLKQMFVQNVTNYEVRLRGRLTVAGASTFAGGLA